MRPKTASSRGFTLVEIMMVMVIITIVTSFAVPNLRSSLYADPLKSTTRKLVGLVAEASQKAVSKRAVYLLNIDFERNQVWISPGKAEEEELERARLRRLDIPGSVRVADVASVYAGKRSAGTTTVRFTEKGYVDRTFIHLRADDGRNMTLMLSPFMAVTRISDAYVELGGEAEQF